MKGCRLQPALRKETSKHYHCIINYYPAQDLKSMKTVALVICLAGSALAIPTYPLIYKPGIHGQKTAEKAQDIHSEVSKEENIEYVNKGHLLSSHRNKNKEVALTDTEHSDEPRPAKTQRRSGSEHQAKNSLKSVNFLSLSIKPGLAASAKPDSDSGSSSREQLSSEYYQFRRHENHNNEQVVDDEENPVDGLSEHNTWKYNKNTVGLSENNSEGDEEEKVEEEEEEWGEEIDHRDMKHKIHLTNQDNQYKRQQNEDSRQSDEIMRDSIQPLRITKRHGEKFDREEKEKDKTYERGKPYEGEKISLSQKSSNQDQDDKQQSQEGKDSSHVNNQSGHETVVERQYKEDSNVDDDDHDSGDADGEEDVSNVWKETTYEEGERIQDNNPGSISTEQDGEGTDEDDSAVSRDNSDYQDAKIKDFVHFEEDYHHHEPPNSDSKEQMETSSSPQSVNSMEPEDKVKTTGRPYNEGESASNSNGKALLDPCRNFHCKRGKVCYADKQEKPRCICQDPAACPSTKDYEHVCGTDNKTYDGTCQLFGTKCQLEGTKMGRQLHLDYMGSCKYIPDCTDYEVDQFPLRMRDWLKNVLMQYYEHDLDTSGFLTEKQRSKVKKIYQNEKRLMAGDHPVELLLHDFEKNYQMYVYPVHWQFYRLDQHPADRLLTHSELAPLRASLVPMEHCITRFFQECDGDKDKLISLKEWCHCFGIKKEDIDQNLLF
ncbi:SPARC-like protein 1 isoform X1 [Struthio camelus]|uniref:SPARC-like protein 1 isoform X1 n=2 Tax=Struthio camelus TaxID=8801 RepID=UPI00360416E9